MSERSPSRVSADVAVVGGGPAGIAAAIAAAEAGRRVVLLDAAPRPGGQVWRHRDRAALPPLARQWLGRLERSGATVLAGAQVVDAAPGWRLGAEREGGAVRVDAPAVILATGAQELFLPFPGWTLPGVIGVGGMQALLKSGWELRGKRVALAGTGPLLLPVAAALAGAGADLRLVAEQAPATAVLRFAASLWRSPARLAQGAVYRSAFRATPYRWGCWITRVDAAGGALRVACTTGRRTWVEEVDLLGTAAGLVPSTELARSLGCAVEGGGVVVDEWQQSSLPTVFAAGEPTGNTGMEAALVEGTIAGLAAAGRRDAARGCFGERARHRRFAARVTQAFRPREELRERLEPGTIVCRCEDVPRSAIAPDWNSRRTKLTTRAGMGSCQGRICGAAMGHLFGTSADTVRTPVVPTSLGLLADLTASSADPEGAP